MRSTAKGCPTRSYLPRRGYTANIRILQPPSRILLSVSLQRPLGREIGTPRADRTSRNASPALVFHSLSPRVFYIVVIARGPAVYHSISPIERDGRSFNRDSRISPRDFHVTHAVSLTLRVGQSAAGWRIHTRALILPRACISTAHAGMPMCVCVLRAQRRIISLGMMRLGSRLFSR